MKKNIISRLLFWILLLIPPLVILYFIYYYGITLPLIDQWEFVPILEKYHLKELSLLDLWGQHNQHRILFPQIIMLALAVLTKWNIMAELYVNYLLGFAILLFLYLLTQVQIYKQKWLIVPISFYVFSVAQWENWGWGWQIQMFLSVLGTIAAIWAIIRWPSQMKGFLISLTAALISCFSFINGLITFFIVGGIIAYAEGLRSKRFLLWGMASLFVIILYYYSYTQPSYIVSFLQHPVSFVLFILAFLGSPIGINSVQVSIAAGIFLLISFCINVYIVNRILKEKTYDYISFISITVYVVLSAIITSVGRSQLGIAHALASRYITISTLFVISSLIFAVFIIQSFINKRIGFKYIIASVLVVLVLGVSYPFSVINGVNKFKQRRAYVNLIEPYFHSIYTIYRIPDDYLRILYPDPNVVRERSWILHEIGYIN
ncbi:MAG: hypothetical protein ABIH39_05185 [Candidatus Margulisiibacteriota bacterium]